MASNLALPAGEVRDILEQFGVVKSPTVPDLWTLVQHAAANDLLARVVLSKRGFDMNIDGDFLDTVEVHVNFDKDPGARNMIPFLAARVLADALKQLPQQKGLFDDGDE